MNENILVVDDQHNIRALLRMYLEREGFRVVEAADGETALQHLRDHSPPDLLILDLMLPGVDGWEICRQVRAGPHGDLPILMLTARDDDVDKIVGLELGADDYVTKPFNPREIVARVKAILRRSTHSAPATTTLRLGDVEIDPQRREVRVQNTPVELRRKEFDLLYTLARQPEIVLSREQLLEQVWGYDFYGHTRTVDVHIAALRRNLAGSTATRIETLTGIGYRITTKE
ncbi:MAG: response regulator transcription factor [Anaerolineae bacterium]|nr:response regulator transcription factor [Anaerolineae bacterium]